MQRVLIPVGVLAVLGIAAWILMYEPPAPAVAPAAPGTAAAATTAPESFAPITRAPKSAAPATDPPKDAGVEPDAGEPSGPVEINLGSHTVSLRDSKKRIKVDLVLTVDNPVTQREVRAKRRKLVRMLYFLSAHRVEDGMLDAGGQQRFLSDLRERFGNVIRTGDIKDLKFTRYEVVEAPPAQPESAPK